MKCVMERKKKCDLCLSERVDDAVMVLGELKINTHTKKIYAKKV